MPRVTVLMTAYNGVGCIEETLESVPAQTRPPDEWIVVDDGSTDATPDIIRVRAPQATLLRRANAGTQAARNAGLARARGDFVALLDQDDLWEPAKLERQAAVLEADPSAVLCHTGFRELRDGRLGPARSTDLGPDPLPTLLHDNPIVCSSVMLRREAAAAFDTEFPFSADWEMWLRLAGRGRFLYLDEPLTTYRVHEGGYSQRREEMLRGEVRLLRERVLAPDAPWRAGASVIPKRGLGRARRRLAWTLYELSKTAPRPERLRLRREAFGVCPSPAFLLRWLRGLAG